MKRPKFQIPEFVLGALLTIAIFATGVLFNASLRSVSMPQRPSSSSWQWITADAAGFFTALLFVVGTVQAALFLWQLRLIRQSSNVAEAAASAANETALATAEANRINRENLIDARRAWLKIENTKLIDQTRFVEDGFLFRVELTVKNLGQTPATAVWIDFESYFAKNNGEKFADVEERFKKKLRLHPPQIGKILFPQDSIIQRQLWADPPEKIRDSIAIRPSGEKRFGFMILIGVAYRIVGDEAAHITYHPYSMLNVPIGMVVPPGATIDLPQEPFLPGEAD